VNTEKKDYWTPFHRFFVILPTVFAALVVWYVMSGSEREKIRLEYVRIAAAILQREADEVESQREMREWAVAILNNSAPVKLSVEQANALIQGTARLPRSAYLDGQGDNYGGYEGGIGPDEAMRRLQNYWPPPTPSPK
jgi:hypothetical protein